MEHCIEEEELKTFFIGENAIMFLKVLNLSEAQALYSVFKGRYFKANLFFKKLDVLNIPNLLKKNYV